VGAAEGADVPIDEIQTTYHPGSRRPSVTRRFEEYQHSMRVSSSVFPDKPWWPFFHSREDFLLSEILLEGGLSNELSERLIKLMNVCISGKGTLTISRYSEVLAAWERASLKLTPVS
jgi:hypothetical protein